MGPTTHNSWPCSPPAAAGNAAGHRPSGPEFELRHRSCLWHGSSIRQWFGVLWPSVRPAVCRAEVKRVSSLCIGHWRKTSPTLGNLTVPFGFGFLFCRTARWVLQFYLKYLYPRTVSQAGLQLPQKSDVCYPTIVHEISCKPTRFTTSVFCRRNALQN